jgi:hypothetical protein
MGPTLFGAEALMEQWLADAPDTQLDHVIARLHEWALAHRDRGFYRFANYFDQAQEEIDAAAKLFRAHRRKLCAPRKDGLYTQLHLFLLYDCLIHVGSLKHKDRPICYLDKPARNQEFFSIAEVVSDSAWHNRLLNYVVHNGKLKINDKRYYHTELAHGLPVEYAGEIVIVNHRGRPTVLINNQSGHYRPEADGIYIATDLMDEGLASLKGPKVRVTLVQGTLAGHVPAQISSAAE